MHAYGKQINNITDLTNIIQYSIAEKAVVRTLWFSIWITSLFFRAYPEREKFDIFIEPSQFYKFPSYPGVGKYQPVVRVKANNG